MASHSESPGASDLKTSATRTSMGVRQTRYEQQVALTAVSEGEGNGLRPVHGAIAPSRTGDRPARSRSIGGEGDALLAVRSLSSLSRQPEYRRGHGFRRPRRRGRSSWPVSSSRQSRPNLVSIREFVVGSIRRRAGKSDPRRGDPGHTADPGRVLPCAGSTTACDRIGAAEPSNPACRSPRGRQFCRTLLLRPDLTPSCRRVAPVTRFLRHPGSVRSDRPQSGSRSTRSQSVPRSGERRTGGDEDRAPGPARWAPRVCDRKRIEPRTRCKLNSPYKGRPT